MKAGCFKYRRRLIRYLDAELPPGKIAFVEDHLAACGACREEYVRLRSARSFAQRMPDRAPEHDLWPGVQAALSSGRAEINRTRDRLGFLKRLLRPPSYISIATASFGMLMMGIGVFLTVGSTRERSESKLETKIESRVSRIDTASFRQVSIDGIKDSDDPHVSAEGYVSDINLDEEDGDLTFRLVSDPSHPQSFVVCEIIDSIKVKPPRPGSRIRVYGVSRYDGQAGHNWYEVHPVLGIEPAMK